VASTGTFEVVGTSLLTGEVTFGTSFTASTGTATIGTAILGATTFTTGFTSSTGTNTLGTIASTTFTNTGVGTTGTLQVGASGPKLTAVTYGTAAFTLSTVAAHNGSGTTNGTVALTGTVLGDMVIGSLDSLGSATGSTGLIIGFHTIGSDVVRFSITNPTWHCWHSACWHVTNDRTKVYGLILWQSNLIALKHLLPTAQSMRLACIT
jgi:hypothetical protein